MPKYVFKKLRNYITDNANKQLSLFNDFELLEPN